MLGRIWERYFIYLVAAVMLGVFAILTPNILSGANIINVLTNAATVAIAAAGMTFAITGGGFDLSIGSTLAITTCVLGRLIPELGLWGSFAIALAVGTLLGAVNGIIITKFQIQTFVATLSTMIIYRGLALIYTQGHDATLYSYLDIKVFTGGDILGVPVPIVLTACVFLLAFAVYRWTPFGVQVRSIGSNITASRVSGIPVDRTLIAIFVVTSVTAVLSGTLLTSQLLTGNGRVGQGFELEAITATILGGTSLSGGRGNIWGTLVAALLLTIIANGLNLLGLPDQYQRLAKGLIFILALTADSVGRLIRERRS
ncbi:MAG: ABC transporter permease [Spirochaetia bacterium]|jgi:ribose/xylose/arabinose/galactoside ABC-type transport system permease subunit